MKFTIVETIVERREVEAETAQDALDLWLMHGQVPGVSEPSSEVTERTVEDEAGWECEVKDG